MKTFYITTSIPYVNAEPHLGHALEFAEADVLARHHRGLGEEVIFLTGTDDNALKNVQAAEEKKTPAQEFVNSRAELFKKLALCLNISNDDFIRTSIEARHIKGAQKLWDLCRKEDIYKKSYSGLYCVGCESFKTEKDLAHGECPEHPGKKLEEVREENYFFKLSNYQGQLEELIASGRLLILPESRRNETLSFIRSGLEDFSISRSRERARGWGVPVPGDETQIMYVWFDALSNYINALGFAFGSENFEKYWQKGDETVHVIGKGINRFHAVYWPAMLISAGLRPPKKVLIHGYVTLEGKKMSKTLGNVIDPFQVAEKYGVDSVRYYLLREIPSDGDGDFNSSAFEKRYNADLANGLGNFAARVLTLGAKIGEITRDEIHAVSPEIQRSIESARIVVSEKLGAFRLHEALEAVWGLIRIGDAYVNAEKPWETGDRKTIVNLIVLLDNIASLLNPFLPETSGKISERIHWSGNMLKVEKGEALFPRLG